MRIAAILLVTACAPKDPNPQACQAPLVVWVDVDGDGFGDQSTDPIETCELSEGFVTDGSDCDDGDAGVHPQQPEACNGIDDNCSGEVDDALEQVDLFADDDGDGHGAGEVLAQGCGPSDGLADNSDDCDDADPARHPGAVEVCDDIDQDCNDRVDDGAPDEDEDGVCDALDQCAAGDDAADADQDGEADACDPCPHQDQDIDIDGNGVADCSESLISGGQFQWDGLPALAPEWAAGGSSSIMLEPIGSSSLPDGSAALVAPIWGEEIFNTTCIQSPTQSVNQLEFFLEVTGDIGGPLSQLSPVFRGYSDHNCTVEHSLGIATLGFSSMTWMVQSGGYTVFPAVRSVRFGLRPEVAGETMQIDNLLVRFR